MSQSSSTSSSRESGGYLAGLAVTVGVLVVGAVLLSVVGIRQGRLTWHFTQLVDYQIDKLAAADRAEILLLGDSSLGNSVDAGAWSEALGRPVVSLALTGVYGYAGGLSMLRRALRRHEVSTVVLVFTFDTMTRPAAHRGLVLTADRVADLFDAPISSVWNTVANLDMPVNILDTLVEGPAIDARGYRRNDYVPQGPSLVAQGGAPPTGIFEVGSINQDKTFYLERIGRLCADENLRCLYVHGPLVESQCSGSAAYRAAVDRRIRAAGFEVLENTPLCIPWAQIGDAPDHVGPAHKAAFSERMLDLVRGAVAR